MNHYDIATTLLALFFLIVILVLFAAMPVAQMAVGR